MNSQDPAGLPRDQRKKKNKSDVKPILIQRASIASDVVETSQESWNCEEESPL